MAVLHAVARNTNNSDTQPDTAGREGAFTRLRRFVEERMTASDRVEDFEHFEVQLRDMFAAAECEVLGRELMRQDVDAPAVFIDGVLHHRVGRNPERYLTGAGEVLAERSIYSTRRPGDRAVVPMELRVGVVAGLWTPLAAKQAAWAVAHLTPRETEELFAQLGRLRPSRSSLDRLPKELGRTLEENAPAIEQALREEESIPAEAVSMAVSLDGVMVPMKDGERSQKRAVSAAAGKETRGPAGYQEASCGTLSFFDADGERLKTIRLARMPEAKKATLKEMLRDEVAWALSQRPDLELVKLADGAHDNWTFLNELLSAALKDAQEGLTAVVRREIEAAFAGTSLVDFYHASEQLDAAMDAAYGEGTPKAKAQSEKLRHVLRHDDKGVEKVIRSLRHLRDEHPRRKKIGTVLGYFRRNRHRMAYAAAKARGLPIGSGVVEAARKTLVTQRLKRSGMRWRRDGGQAILTLRALAQSERFERAWPMVLQHYKASVTLPANVIELRPTAR